MTGHDDHKAACRWATEAFTAVAPPGAVLGYATNSPEWLEEFREPLDRFNVFMGAEPPCTPRDEQLFSLLLEGELLETKLAAISSMTSQVEPLIAGLGVDFFRRGLIEESFRHGP